MRSITRVLLGIIAPLVAVGAIVFTAGTVLADEVEQLKLVINIVQGSMMNKNDAQNIAKQLDDILKQCDKYGLRMRVTPEIRTGVTKIDGLDPVPGDDVTEAQETKINQAGEQEVSGGGYKITVISSFDNENTNGSTTRKTSPGPTPTSVPMPASAVDDDYGADTWGHELGHGLGLEHSTDPKNLMFGVKANRTGTELTEDQCKKLKAGFQKRGAVKKCSEGQQTSGLCTPATESVNDAVFDPEGDATNPMFDLQATLFTFDLDPVTPSLLTGIRVGLFPPGSVSVAYEIGFDTDNNALTGGPFGPFGPGFEFAAVVEAAGTFPFEGSATASLIPLAGGGPIPLEAPQFLQVFEHVDVDAPPEVPEQEIAAEAALSIPVAALGPLANPMRVAVMALQPEPPELKDQAPDEPPAMISTQPDPGPGLVVSPRTAPPGQLLTITGSGFASSSELTLLLANELLGETVTEADGTFSADANIPPLPADHYLLDAIDDEGNIGLEVVTITNLPVGGEAQLPQASDSSGPNHIALAAAVAGALLALTAVAWYATRRWHR